MEFQVYSRAVKLLFAVLLLTTSHVFAYVGADTTEYPVNDNDGATSANGTVAITVLVAMSITEASLETKFAV